MAGNFIARLCLDVCCRALLTAKRRPNIDLTNTSLLTTTALLVAILPWCPFGHFAVYHRCIAPSSLLEIASASETTEFGLRLDVTMAVLLCINVAQ